MTLEELQVVIEAQTSQFKKEIKAVQSEVNSMTASVNKQVSSIKNVFSRVGKFLAALGLGKILRDSIKSAMNAIESENLVGTVFGNMTDDIRKWSNELQETLGLNAYSVRENAAVLFNMSKSLGLTKDRALDLSKNLTLLAEDMASFYNLSGEEAFNKIKSGLTGETEPLKALGIMVDENTLKQYGYSSSLSNSEKVMIRYKAIMAQTGAAHGDLARTINSPANQARILKNNIQLLGIEFGRAFMPILTVVLPILNSFVQGLTRTISVVATFMNTLFGTEFNGNSGGIGSLGTSFADATIGATGLEDAIGGTGDKAKKTAKEVNRLLGGFDEINTFNKDNEDNGIGPDIVNSGIGRGNSGFNLGLDKEPDTSGLNKVALKIKEFFSSIDYTPLKNSFEGLKNSITPIVENIGKVLGWFIENILGPLTRWTIQDFLPAFFNLLAGAFDVLNPVLESFMRLGSWLWDSFLQPIASWTGGVIVDTLNGLANVLSGISDWMNDNQDVVDKITSSVIAFFAAWQITKLLGFIGESGGVIQALARISKALFATTAAKIADKFETMALTAMYAKDFVMSIVNSTVALFKQATQFAINTGLKVADTAAQVAMNAATVIWNAVCGIATVATTALGTAFTFLTSPIGLVILAITAVIAVGVLLYKHWDEVKAKAIEVWGSIKDTFNIFREWLGNVFATDWSTKFGIFGDILNGFFYTVGNIFSSVKQIFGGIIDFVAGVFTGDWGRAWQGVQDIFAGIFRGLASIVKAPMNAVISIINGAISGINKISFDVPDWVPEWAGGGKHFGISIPRIPYLAKGGIVDSPTLSMIGERGKEAVMPLENNTGWITDLAYKISMLSPNNNNNNSFGDAPIEITLKIGDTTLGKYAADGINKLSRQKGRCVINV